MATSKAIPIPTEHESWLDADRHDLLGLTLSASLPLAVFIIANGMGELAGALPLFFSPFGLPGWLGAALHIGSLPLLGAARWMVAERGAVGRSAGWWLVALMAGLIVFPFAVAPLDSLQLAIAATSLVVVGLGAWLRTAAVSPRAAWVMAPAIIWLGFSALVGMAFIAAFTPPFGLTNAHSAQANKVTSGCVLAFAGLRTHLVGNLVFVQRPSHDQTAQDRRLYRCRMSLVPGGFGPPRQGAGRPAR